MVEERQNIGFQEWHAGLDLFVEEANVELRARGFHACEIQVVADWQGKALLHAVAPTSAKNPQGGAVFLACDVLLPPVWAMDEAPPLDNVLDVALARAEEVLVATAAQHKVLRLTFAAYARMQARNVVVAADLPKERKSALIAP